MMVSISASAHRPIARARVLSAAPAAVLLVIALIAWRRPDLLDTRAGSIALWITTAFAIVSAALAVCRSGFVPWPGQLIVCLIAAYAAGSMTLALREGTPYIVWLNGASIWLALPVWLRGGFVGLFVVVPIGIAVQALKIAVPRWRAGRLWREANRGLVLTLCVLVVASPIRMATNKTGGHLRGATGTAQSVIAPLELTSLALPEPAPAIEPADFLKRAESLTSRFARADWDVDAKADALPAGIEPAFAFVRDSIGYQAYSGVLRGARGTYSERAGNAVDRALLLAHLLARKNVSIRFAVGRLGDAERDRLWTRIFESPMPPERRNPTPVSTTVGPGLHERIFRRAKRDYDVVRSALGSKLPPVSKPSREDVLAEMNPHVWLQALVDERWIDLDPSLPSATAGAAMAALESTLTELPTDYYQRVNIRISAERLIGGELVSSTLTEVTRNIVDVVDKQVFFVQTSGHGGGALGGLGGAMASALGRRQSAPWTPALWIDGEFTGGTAFSVDSSNQVFVAEWLEFELMWPSGRREVMRRPIVDRGSAEWRAARPRDASALQPLGGDDAGPYALQALHNVWFSAGRHNLAAFAEATRDLAHEVFIDELTRAGVESEAGEPESETEERSSDGGFIASVWPFGLQNFAWMVWTDHVIVPALGVTPGLRLYADGPRIAIFTSAPLGDERFAMISDLRRDDLRGLVMDPSKSRVLAERKLWFGLLQGALEQEALAEVAAFTGGDPRVVETTSSRLSSEGIIALAPGDSLPSLAQPPQPAISARLSGLLTDGHVLVVPVAGLARGGSWWEIVPGSGDMRAVSPLGLHGGKIVYRWELRAHRGEFPGSGWYKQGTPSPKATVPDWVRKEELRELEKREREIWKIQKEAAARAQYQNSLAMKSQRPASTSSGYTLLLVIGAAIKAAIDIIMWHALERLFLSVVEFIRADYRWGWHAYWE